MSQAEELLDDIMPYTSDPSSEGHIAIGMDRYIIIPDELKKIAVQHDHKIETVTFDCPRYWDKHDMSKMYIYVNYMRPDDVKGSDLATNVVVDENDENIMHFDWTITGHMTEIPGPITFLVCVQKVAEDGTTTNHWNSELSIGEMYVSPGLECEETVVAIYPGIITSVLNRMDIVEAKTTRESMLGYVEAYLMETSPNWLEEFFVSDTVLNMVRDYMIENGVQDGTKIIIGTEPPTREAIWFNVTSVVDGVDPDVNYGLRVTDPDTNIEYVLHIVDGKLTMSKAIE